MNALGHEYEATYASMLQNIVNAGVLRDRRHVAFWPMRGSRYDGDLFIVGRAVNRWDAEWEESDAVTPGGRARVIARAREVSYPADECPLEWVRRCWGAAQGTYNTRRSAFWRTAYRLCVEREAERPDWASSLCWSDLYKVAPAAGGNPGARLSSAQFEFCAALLKREVEAYMPRRVLVMTGRDWFEPFATAMGLKVSWMKREYVEGVAREDGRTWVITKHPDRKKDSALSQAAWGAFRLPVSG